MAKINKKEIMRIVFIKLVILITAILTLSGCATALLGLAPPIKDYQQVKTLVMEDEIVAIASANETTDKSTAGDMVLIGKNHAYHITQGNEHINMMMQLDPQALAINNNNPIEFTIKDSKFSGQVQITYRKSEYSEAERKMLARNRFAWDSTDTVEHPYGYFHAYVTMAGTVYSKLESNDFTPFSKGRQVKFFNLEIKKAVNVKNAIDLVVALPFTVAFDVITLPLQVIMFGSAGGVNSVTHTKSNP
jgi:uncharacterized protein YceK